MPVHPLIAQAIEDALARSAHASSACRSRARTSSRWSGARPAVGAMAALYDRRHELTRTGLGEAPDAVRLLFFSAMPPIATAARRGHVRSGARRGHAAASREPGANPGVRGLLAAASRRQPHQAG